MDLDRWYVLEPDHTIRVIDNMDELSEYYALGIDARRVGLERVGRYEVSTVFLVHNHRHFGDGPPIVFETMIFDTEAPDHDWKSIAAGEVSTSDGGRWLDLWCDRYCTWDEAKAGHDRVIAELRAGKTPDEIEAS